MEQNEPFDHRQSFSLIEQMIQEARNEHRERGDGWLIWGWLLFGASVTSVALMFYESPQYIGTVWTGMLIIGLLIVTLANFIKPGQRDVTSYAAGLLKKIGVGFFISLFAMVAASFISRNSFAFGYYYILYAFWMFIYGSALQFRPLLVGAVVNWIAAIAIFLINDFFYTMIISAVAILIGYLIPGYILRNRFYKTTSRKKVLE